MLPLSLLAFRRAAAACSLPRTAVPSPSPFIEYISHLNEQVNSTQCHASLLSTTTQTKTSGEHSINRSSISQENFEFRCSQVDNQKEENDEKSFCNSIKPAWPLDEASSTIWQSPEAELTKGSPLIIYKLMSL